MEKKSIQIAIAVILLILVVFAICAAVLNSGPNEEIGILDVTFWVSSDIAQYPAPPSFSKLVKSSALIVSATAAASNEKWDTADGKPWTADPENPKPGESFRDHYDLEVRFDNVKVLKGDYEINEIFLKTNAYGLEFTEGDSYILFIYQWDQNGTYYYSIAEIKASSLSAFLTNSSVIREYRYP